MIDAGRNPGIGASADPLWKGRDRRLTAGPEPARPIVGVHQTAMAVLAARLVALVGWLVRVQLVHDSVAAAAGDQPAIDRERATGRDGRLTSSARVRSVIDRSPAR